MINCCEAEMTSCGNRTCDTVVVFIPSVEEPRKKGEVVSALCLHKYIMIGVYWPLCELA